MPKLQGLIFDLDGTLIDSAPDLRQALNATLHDSGRRDLSLNEVKSMVGDGMMPLIERAYDSTGGLPDGFNAYGTFQTFIGHYRAMQPDPAQIYPKVRETLEIYQAVGVKLGVCTNKQEAATIKLMDDLDLTKYFGFIAGGDTFPVHKPNPGHVTGVIERLGVAAANCAMVGDSSNDVRAARGANISSIVVMHGYGGDFGELGADKLIKGFEELPGALNELGFILNANN